MKVLVVIGTRPEAVKLAPLVHKLKEARGINPVVCISSQHRELLDQMLSFFQVVPDYDLNVMTPGQSLADVTTKVLHGISDILSKESFDVVIAQGDTTTAFTSGLAAFYQRIPFAHVEAGLRSGDLASPFPEEGNRRLVDVISDYLFAPTEPSKENLLREGFAANKVFVTGNTAIDALYFACEQLRNQPSRLPITLNPEERLILVTAHRRESFNGGIERICQAILELANHDKSLRFLYPVHPNPNVRKVVNDYLAKSSQVSLVEPLEYLDFVSALMNSDLILTDSGGVQEEAPALGKRILVLRETTERPEGVDAGVAELVGTDVNLIVQRARAFLSQTHETRNEIISPYGDGMASDRIVEVLATGGLTNHFVPDSNLAPQRKVA